MILPQQTLQSPVRARGVGLHSGRAVTLLVRPAPADSGIVFRRTDVPDPVDVPALVDRVSSTQLATRLGEASGRIETIEHLMAAFAGLGIDNALVDVDGPELPIMDGSAAPFVFLLESGGLRRQEAPRRFLAVRKAVRVSDGDAWASLEPFDGCRLEYTLDYDHPAFGDDKSFVAVDLSASTFSRDLARARTFGFLADYDRLRAMNLALGGSLDNAVVVDDAGVVNADGLRRPDEFARHKLLDAVGDLYLAGGPLWGRFQGYKSGHRMNVALLNRLLSDASAWSWTTREAD